MGEAEEGEGEEEGKGEQEGEGEEGGAEAFERVDALRKMPSKAEGEKRAEEGVEERVALRKMVSKVAVEEGAMMVEVGIEEGLSLSTGPDKPLLVFNPFSLEPPAGTGCPLVDTKLRRLA